MNKRLFALLCALLVLAGCAPSGPPPNANCLDAKGDVVLGCVLKKTVFGAVVDNAGNITISHTTGDMDLNGHPVHSGADPTLPQDLATKNYIDSRGIAVQAAAVADLPASTYSNGSSGVNSTLTENSNGVLPPIDGVTLGSGDCFLIQQRTNRFENGVYCATNLGGAGSTFVVTRHPNLDQAAEFPGARVRVKLGNRRAGGEYSYLGPSVTVGTSPVFLLRTDAKAGPDEVIVHVDDLTENAAVANAPGSAGWARFTSGTGVTVAAQSTNSASAVGEILCASGTSTATGMCGIANAWTASNTAADGGESIVYSTSNVGFSLTTRITAPVLSNGTNTFAINAGLMKQRAPSQKIFADGCGFIYDTTSAVNTTDWLAGCTTGGVGTPVDTTISLVAATYNELQVVTYPGSSSVAFYVDKALKATVTTNLPNSTLLGMAVGVFKNTGTAATNMMKADYTSLRVDFPAGRF
ncbi:MAG TPA: hypothetical protein VH062_02125 [Polyangiaceae bacterium]|jgi:hypothetical protein|nr:hypothetical protein [Polyangiaceae bacterium]